jgi:hypothetical protein
MLVIETVSRLALYPDPSLPTSLWMVRNNSSNAVVPSFCRRCLIAVQHHPLHQAH